MELDRNYIAPRYPDAYPEGAPFEYYSEEVARYCQDNWGITS
ncbi:hypothetical protein PF0757 [Pyrococcus furiosus DSM 3638]|nr:hypothetical protein PF0757 [Pyrococcus furiosus DSM 3638]